MSSYTFQHEEAVFQAMLPQLEAEGYSVFVRPYPGMLPEFARSYSLDAIAFKGDRKVAIEIASSPRSGDRKLNELQQIFSKHPDWEFRIWYAPTQSAEALPVLSRDVIERQLQEISVSLRNAGSTASAILIAWATFEAAARRSIPTTLARPQTSSRLIEVLASQGHVTPDEAHALRDLSVMRNEIAHGRLDRFPGREQIERLVAVTRTILDLAG